MRTALSGLEIGDSTKALIGQTPSTVTITGEVKFDAGLKMDTLPPASTRASGYCDNSATAWSTDVA